MTSGRPAFGLEKMVYLSSNIYQSSRKTEPIGMVSWYAHNKPGKPSRMCSRGNQSIVPYLSVPKDSFSNPPTNGRLEEAVVVDWA
ncbi:hypothetical protein AVEN_257598-1 [Araneus ventricosus]|uniref:Uncharacterized protein n=1 Tax=Araneus ventricosus TaxID=182803 RepID=A0A4Y2XC31_ARAVE|nr:hypothetical protein AVEN_257598-1 [Araneus ventricosus]